jgi:hypothetical protein
MGLAQQPDGKVIASGGWYKGLSLYRQPQVSKGIGSLGHEAASVGKSRAQHL